MTETKYVSQFLALLFYLFVYIPGPELLSWREVKGAK